MSFQLLRHFKRFSLADTACHVLKEGWDMASHILLRKRRQQNAWSCDWRGFRNSEGQFFPRQSCSPGSFTVALRVTTALNEDSAFLLSKQQTIHLQNPPGPLCQTMPERPCSQGFRMYADKRSFVRTTSVESFVELLCIRLGCQASFNQTSLRPSTNVQTIHSQLFADTTRKRQLTENYKKKRNKSEMDHRHLGSFSATCVPRVFKAPVGQG